MLRAAISMDTSATRLSDYPTPAAWALQDSNLGPTDYESAALTTELRAPKAITRCYTVRYNLVQAHNPVVPQWTGEHTGEECVPNKFAVNSGAQEDVGHRPGVLSPIPLHSILPRHAGLRVAHGGLYTRFRLTSIH